MRILIYELSSYFLLLTPPALWVMKIAIYSWGGDDIVWFDWSIELTKHIYLITSSNMEWLEHGIYTFDMILLVHWCCLDCHIIWHVAWFHFLINLTWIYHINQQVAWTWALRRANSYLDLGLVKWAHHLESIAQFT